MVVCSFQQTVRATYIPEINHAVEYRQMSALVLVFGRRQSRKTRALNWPASKERQGTKSRAAGHWLTASYVDLMLAPISIMGRTPARRDLHVWSHAGRASAIGNCAWEGESRIDP